VSKRSYPDIVFYLCISITIITPRTFSLFYLFLVSILADYINKNTIICVFFLYFENAFETKNKEEYKNVLKVLFSDGFFIFMYTYL
jgi:hypothetical protein